MFRNFTQYIDVTQMVLYAFWVGFFGLMLYLRREDKREGYPLVTKDPAVRTEGFPGYPGPKEFIPPHSEH
jgi:photosynthetic reaction center H subunit